MIEELKPYPAYKDSGVPWLGKVPEHWTIERAKWLFQKVNRSVHENDDVVTCFRDGTVTLRKKRRLRGYTESIKEIGYQGVQRGDLVIHAMDAFAGAIGVSDSDGKSSPVYAVCQPQKNVSAYYYAYLVREMARTQWILALAKGIRERSTDFRFDTFASSFLSFPPPEEQTAIAAFLDYADRRIHRYIRSKQKLIKLLEEQKQVVINQAVTRGLDPDVPLKPSGVEWLGDIPEHWELKKIKSLVTSRGGMTPSKAEASYWDGNIPWVSPKDMKVLELLDSEDHISSLALQKTSITLLHHPVVLIVVRGMILARTFPVAVTRVPVTINQDMKALSPNDKLSPEFLLHILIGFEKDLLRLVEESGHGTRCLRTDDWENFILPIPSLDEQAAIINYLKSMSSKICKAVDDTYQEISLLREFRTRLIADVVTGKLDVREAAAKLPVEIDETELSDEALDTDELELDEDLDPDAAPEDEAA